MCFPRMDTDSEKSFQDQRKESATKLPGNDTLRTLEIDEYGEWIFLNANKASKICH